MRIETVDIQNVLRFERFEATFAPSFNVVIGDNGAGKTTLLTLLRRVLSVWSRAPVRVTATDLARETIHAENGALYRQPHRPWRFSAHGRGPDGVPIEHTEHEGRLVVGNVRAGKLHRAAEQDVRVPLPVLVYFSPWREPPAKRKPLLKLKGPPRRLEGYHDALDLHADFKDFASWFKAFEMQRVEGGAPVPAVEAARETVIRCIPGCTDLRWVPVLNDIVVRIDGENHLIWRLSDGFRTMLALVGEVAWRAAVLNPAFGGNVAREVEGIVLIDELDLHLHPRWQRRVVADLRAAFPKVQFIATTHSPFVVQSMGADEVINLDRAAQLDFQRSSIEDISEVEMGVEGVTRSRMFQQKVEAAREYLTALEQRPANETELRALKDRLDEIQSRYGADPVYVASLLQKRAARGLE